MSPGWWTVIFLALALVTGVTTIQQQQTLASPTQPYLPRQIAYEMRVFHRASLSYKGTFTAATGPISNPPPSMVNQFRYSSCADAKSVVTFPGGTGAGAAWAAGLGFYQNNAVATELARQSVSPPELGINAPARVAGYNGGTVPQVIPVPGVGLSTGTEVQSGAGAISLPAGCAVPAGLPVIVTQVLP
jgi:hypothetical protein